MASTPPPSPDASWRDSSRQAKLAFLDCSAVMPLLIFLFDINWHTFTLAMIGVVFLSALAKVGFTPRIFGRWLRNFIAGQRKLSSPWWL